MTDDLMCVRGIVFITGKTILFVSEHPVFTSLGFATVVFFMEQGHQPCIQPQPGGTGLCIYVH